MPHLGRHDKGAAAAAGMPPKGWMAVRVGQEGEERRRFVVPVGHLNHPLFAQLLHEAEEEYGFSQKGAIVIPCDVEHFLHVKDTIDREYGAGEADGHHDHHHHHHHHGNHHHDHHQRIHGVHHHHLPHFTACFGA